MCNGYVRQLTTYYGKVVAIGAITIMSSMLNTVVAVLMIVFTILYIIAMASTIFA